MTTDRRPITPGTALAITPAVSLRPVPDGVDPWGPRRTPTNGHSLAPFVDATVLDAADVHVAATLAELGGDTDPGVSLAAALAVRAVRQGSVVVDIATVAERITVDDGTVVDLAALPWPDPAGWLDALASSPLVAVGDDGPVDRPLRLLDGRLALDRYWRHERRVAADLLARAARPIALGDPAAASARLIELFPDGDEQRLAAAAALVRSGSVVAGGPGTGKTTTIARILALLLDLHPVDAPPLRIALAAPTGKAAARLDEAIQGQVADLPVDDRVKAALRDVSASTLHRLLGFNPGNRSRFRHDRHDPLPHHVVVVDETSMVSLSIMSRLVEAVRPDTRLVLVGDPQQLTSVEAGAVLGDIVGPARDRLRMRPPARAELEALVQEPVTADDDDRPVSIGDGIVVLRRVHRFAGAVSDAARAIEAGDADALVDVLRGTGGEGDGGSIRWHDLDVTVTRDGPSIDEIREPVVDQALRVIDAATAGDSATALAALADTQLLCAHRRGPAGVSWWRRQIELRVSARRPGAVSAGWFVGRPVLVTVNDRQLDLYNGDTGVVVSHEDGPRCAFERRGGIVHVSPSRLSAVETMYAMTIHKSQGSQFRHVLVVLPDATSPILTRELLYTAVTRASEQVTLVGTEAAVRAAVERPVSRASGLRERLWGPAEPSGDTAGQTVVDAT